MEIHAVYMGFQIEAHPQDLKGFCAEGMSTIKNLSGGPS